MRVAVEVGKTAHLYTADGKSLEFKWAHAMSIEVADMWAKWGRLCGTCHAVTARIKNLLMPHGFKGWAIFLSAQAVLTFAWRLLAKLAENAMLTWSDDQIASF